MCKPSGSVWEPPILTSHRCKDDYLSGMELSTVVVHHSRVMVVSEQIKTPCTKLGGVSTLRAIFGHLSLSKAVTNNYLE